MTDKRQRRKILRLYGHYGSQPFRTVAWLLKMHRLPFEFVKVDPMSGSTRDEQFLSKFPLGLIPAMEEVDEDGGGGGGDGREEEGAPIADGGGIGGVQTRADPRGRRAGRVPVVGLRPPERSFRGQGRRAVGGEEGGAPFVDRVAAPRPSAGHGPVAGAGRGSGPELRRSGGERGRPRGRDERDRDRSRRRGGVEPRLHPRRSPQGIHVRALGALSHRFHRCRGMEREGEAGSENNILACWNDASKFHRQLFRVQRVPRELCICIRRLSIWKVRPSHGRFKC
mmetsp:Transcript_25323/g.51714  ORF Transcript_25323/g.51714 Transcript_25323/m.51714 type:complete len:282 (+) Transcript_25323:150-995(+)